LGCDWRFAELVDRPIAEVQGRPFQDLANLEDGALLDEALSDLWQNPADAIVLESRRRIVDGTLSWLRLIGISGIDRTQRVPHLSLFVENINRQRAAEAMLLRHAQQTHATERRYRNAFQICPVGVVIAQMSNGAILDANPAFLRLMGYERDDVIGRTSMDLEMWATASDRISLSKALQKNAGCRNLEARLRTRSGGIFWARISASFADINGIPCVLSFMEDISVARAEEERYRSLALFDTLTGLPNRRLLWERMRKAQAMSNRKGARHGLLFLDLDNFKSLNDTMGHQTGDLVLQETARRILSSVRQCDTVARLGGDEFVIILEDLGCDAGIAVERAKLVGKKIRSVLTEPLMVKGRDCHRTISMGLTIFGSEGENVDEVLRQADQAMYQAKQAGRNGIFSFSPTIRHPSNARNSEEQDLNRAIEKREFLLYLQPQIDGDATTAAEGLIRWKHPDRGILSPSDFLPLAEASGKILSIGSWVLEAGCRKIAEWKSDASKAQLTLAVNVSREEFQHPRFVEMLLSLAASCGADLARLQLDINESAALTENFGEVLSKMLELKAHGVQFALNEVGYGSRSVASIKLLPFDQLQIDRSIVQEVPQDPMCRAASRAVVAFGQAKGIAVVAKGIENDAQREFFANLGCSVFQGFLFGYPSEELAFYGAPHRPFVEG
jgi:diguanylate cyclase (GGDEF)-like protein/PAS domain S-box-containing protein